ncbi:DUF2946 domain-containing protein [Paraburkholderia humisilvae]|uniref:DUF2946 domain-containing protein n=1 Tax=Paraburkholderia humisilvae TaxID=627669 RepID=A0A6J5E681_9BURK|nr:DUF2946 domain-containing protein [Paraburkholderia humisilvae]CAB3761437.1 hypothetical protein LMG29542_04080 [Paraburkholderia humisilvae]
MQQGLIRKIGSLLGLVAILMATLAPTISQTLAASRHLDALCSAQSFADDGAGSRPGSHTQMSHGDACAYCSLLAHVPVVPSVQVPFAVTVWLIEHRRAVRFDTARRVEPLTSSQPRAPPFPS